MTIEKYDIIIASIADGERTVETRRAGIDSYRNVPAADEKIINTERNVLYYVKSDYGFS
ncbi:MAG: hypothetical protein FWH17_00860 [Oscillospiraceae bacterium]|nr:hypothetical protein [Oscillospiraceae bacterium]